MIVVDTAGRLWLADPYNARVLRKDVYLLLVQAAEGAIPGHSAGHAGGRCPTALHGTAAPSHLLAGRTSVAMVRLRVVFQ